MISNDLKKLLHDPSARRRLARVCLVVGLLAAATTVLPELPRDTPVTFAFNTDAAKRTRVTRLEVSYSPRGSEATSGSFTLYFPEGAPNRVTHTIRTVSGDYDLDVSVGTAMDFSKAVGKTQPRRTDFQAKTAFVTNGATRFTRPVTLNGNPATIILKLRGLPK